LSAAAASEIEFELPPYDLTCLKRLHRHLFRDLYDWAGEIRTVDISKGNTRFCNVARIEPEASKVFDVLADRNWLEGFERDGLVASIAEYYGDLNVVHPFREGNGRAQRLLFEQIIVNAGFEIDWWKVEPDEWLQANIDAVVCDYARLAGIFEKCIGSQIST
jgi:cell filamentation protein